MILPLERTVYVLRTSNRARPYSSCATVLRRLARLSETELSEAEIHVERFDTTGAEPPCHPPTEKWAAKAFLASSRGH